MSGTRWGPRIEQAILTYSAAVGRRVGLEEFGRLIAAAEGRETPYTKAAVSNWVTEKNEPSIRVFEAIAAVTGADAWWFAWGVGRPPSNVALDYFTPEPRPRPAKKAAAKKRRP